MRGCIYILILALWACSESSEVDRMLVSSNKTKMATVAVAEFNKQKAPSSSRSKEVIERVASRLMTELESQGLELGAPIFLRIFKEERDLEVWLKKDEKFHLFRTYNIAAMSGELGPKLREGDCQAPEGFYFVTPSRMNPNSSYHLSFNIGYPNSYDRAYRRTGSALMVHGNQVSIGCFAMTDSKVEEIYTLADCALRNGQKFFRVHSFPFRMTEANMDWHQNARWIHFWENLQQGYEAFEKTKLPPNVEVENQKYVFTEDN